MDGFGLGAVRFATLLYPHDPGGQKGTNSVLARTPVDVAVIVLKREWRKSSAGAAGVPFEKGIEGLLPRLEMDARGIRDHTIEIKGCGIKSRRNKAGFARHLSTRRRARLRRHHRTLNTSELERRVARDRRRGIRAGFALKLREHDATFDLTFLHLSDDIVHEHAQIASRNIFLFFLPFRLSILLRKRT